ncbi:MAG: OmpA family protein [Sneathiella sp.]|nr:OmpA family protein [Sneathiella sp.]
MNKISNASESWLPVFWKRAGTLTIVTAMLAVAGCSTDNTEEQAAADYPSVNAVPEKPETVASLSDAREIEEGLRSDREKARYTDEALRADTAIQPPKAEPAVTQSAPVVKETPPPPAPKEPDVAAVPTEPVKEAPLAAPAEASTTPPPATAETSTAPAPPESMAPKSATEKTIAAAAPTPDTMTPDEGVNRVFEDRLNASSVTALPEGMKSTETDAAPASSAAPASRAAPAPVDNSPVVMTPPDGSRLIPNYAASDGRTPIETIYFAQGSHRIDAADREKLERIARTQMAAGGKLKVVGHASSRTRQMPETRHMIVNLNVSNARAAAVAEFLLKAGVAPGDLVIESVSDADPLINEPMPSAEAKNRRAEIFLLN